MEQVFQRGDAVQCCCWKDSCSDGSLRQHPEQANSLEAIVGNLCLLVADDHDVVRRGVRTLLEEQPGWEVVAEASNGREAVERAKLTQPDVTILD